MDLKDAEYQEWLALEYMEEMQYNYNKPHISFFTKKPLDNTKIFTEDWWLKPMMQSSSVFCYDKGSNIADFKKVGRDVRVIGTELQLYNLFCKMSDEKGWQVKDSWDAKMKPEYLDLYKNNNNNPLIINLI
jgi:hypothetical protein